MDDKIFLRPDYENIVYINSALHSECKEETRNQQEALHNTIKGSMVPVTSEAARESESARLEWRVCVRTATFAAHTLRLLQPNEMLSAHVAPIITSRGSPCPIPLEFEQSRCGRTELPIIMMIIWYVDVATGSRWSVIGIARCIQSSPSIDEPRAFAWHHPCCCTRTH